MRRTYRTVARRDFAKSKTMEEKRKEYLTKKKYDELVVELGDLKNAKRKEIAEDLDHARDLGDLSENAEYQEVRARQADLEERIAKLEEILKNTMVVEDKHGDHAVIGSTVVVEKTNGSKKMTLMIVGKKKGEVFSFNSPNGKMEYKVVEVK